MVVYLLSMIQAIMGGGLLTFHDPSNNGWWFTYFEDGMIQAIMGGGLLTLRTE